jgi:hypothetical protein
MSRAELEKVIFILQMNSHGVTQLAICSIESLHELKNVFDQPVEMFLWDWWIPYWPCIDKERVCLTSFIERTHSSCCIDSPRSRSRCKFG